VLLENIRAPIDLPPFDNSAMDGYAVRSADVASARADAPTRLRLIGKVAAGAQFHGELIPQTCVRLFTGSPLPRGADAVVMQEDTRSVPDDPSTILVLDRCEPQENVRFRGEDVARGRLLLSRGERLSFSQLTLLSATGLGQLKVGHQPRIGVLATGSELRAAGATLSGGQIYDSNSFALDALVRAAGAVPVVLPVVKDSLEATCASLTEGFSHCDAVVTSGGASVGELDLVKQAFQQSGGSLEFWKVSIKPGRPFVFGRLNQKLLFGLPGNPVSAIVTFLLLVRPALLRWQGASDLSLPSHPAHLAEAIANPGSRRHFMRVKIGPDGKVHSAGIQASHALSSLASANGLLDLAPSVELPAGALVRVIRWD